MSDQRIFDYFDSLGLTHVRWQQM